MPDVSNRKNIADMRKNAVEKLIGAALQMKRTSGSSLRINGSGWPGMLMYDCTNSISLETANAELWA